MMLSAGWRALKTALRRYEEEMKDRDAIRGSDVGIPVAVAASRSTAGRRA
jgi:hypothetical protein